MHAKAHKSFQKTIGYKFKKAAWLEMALTHPSYRHERDGSIPDNQRLEFLGDAVIGLLSAEYLFDIRPELDEGAMTKFRSMVTSRSGLAAIGLSWKIGGQLLLGKGESMSGGASRDSNLADAVEAVIGGIFQDGGMKACRKFFKRHFEPKLDELLKEKDIQVSKDNPKGSLQERVQARGGETPVYRILTELGPAHEREYEAAVFINGQEVARGIAPNKRAAEAKAAAAALDALSVLTMRSEP